MRLSSRHCTTGTTTGMTLGSSMVGYCSLTLTLDLLTWTEIGSEVKKMMTTWTEVGVLAAEYLRKISRKISCRLCSKNQGYPAKCISQGVIPNKNHRFIASCHGRVQNVSMCAVPTTPNYGSIPLCTKQLSTVGTYMEDLSTYINPYLECPGSEDR